MPLPAPNDFYRHTTSNEIVRVLALVEDVTRPIPTTMVLFMPTQRTVKRALVRRLVNFMEFLETGVARFTRCDQQGNSLEEAPACPPSSPPLSSS